MKRFKIRCSAIGTLMSGTMDLSDTQLKKLVEYDEREQGVFKNNPKLTLTDKMKEDRDELLALQKVKQNELPKGAKTYVKKWTKDYLYGRKFGFTSKYTEKGNKTENEAIKFFIDQFPEYGWGAKNEDWFVNDYTHGTPDLLVDLVVDTKSNYTHETFPLFPDDEINETYEWQVRGYMWLTGKEEAIIAHCLMDMPEDMIWNEVRRAKYDDKNEGKDDDQLYEEIKALYTYSDLDPALRIRTYHVKRDLEKEEQIKKRVNVANDYIQTILPEKVKELLEIKTPKKAKKILEKV